MTWEIARHLDPAKVLVVRRDDVDFVDHERFPDARWCELEHGRLPVDAVDWLTRDVDVLYSAETFYSDSLVPAARARGVRTVLHGMWEYLTYRQHQARRALPDLFLAPNPWHLAEWPQPCRLLPVPVAGDRFPIREAKKVATIVHCAGAPAKGDRNGTTSLLEALRLVRVPVHVVIRTQAPVHKPILRGPVKLSIEPPSSNYWEVFAGADAAVLPRRYGGLSLPLQEATALGLPVLGLSRERQAGYDHAAIVHCTERRMGLPCGPVERADVDPALLARAIEHLVADREWALELSQRSASIARSTTWEALRPHWEAVLAELVGECSPSTS